MGIGGRTLHPFRHRHPGFIFIDGRDTKVPQPRTFLRNKNLLGFLYDVQPFRIDLGNEQRRAVPENMIVLGIAPGIDEP